MNENYYLFYENINKFNGCFYVEVKSDIEDLLINKNNILEDSKHVNKTNDIFSFKEYQPFTRCDTLDEFKNFIREIEGEL